MLEVKELRLTYAPGSDQVAALGLGVLVFLKQLSKVTQPSIDKLSNLCSDLGVSETRGTFLASLL